VNFRFITSPVYSKTAKKRYSAFAGNINLTLRSFLKDLGAFFATQKTQACRGFRRLRGRWPPAVAPPLQKQIRRICDPLRASTHPKGVDGLQAWSFAQQNSGNNCRKVAILNPLRE
jgi:hypothetical protein